MIFHFTLIFRTFCKKYQHKSSMYASSTVQLGSTLTPLPSSQPQATEKVCFGTAFFLLGELGELKDQGKGKFAWGAWEFVQSEIGKI